MYKKQGGAVPHLLSTGKGGKGVMALDIAAVMERVPHSESFLTIRELDESTLDLAARYPGLVEAREVGRSREGRPIRCLKIGSGSRNALLFACPHPNEPIGAMTLDFLARELAENSQLRESMDYTWYLIKVSDPDGIALNEGWFKGPFTIHNYLRHYYRPAFHEQVEWTFPVSYKRLHFDAPLPETRVLMDLIEALKPDFVYPLHNLGFGGAYWYLSRPAPQLYEGYYACVRRMGVPRKLGEAEVPYAKSFAPAVFQMLTVKDDYDYTETYTDADPVAGHPFGTSSGDYAMRHGAENPFVFVCELPYFFERRIDDLTPSEITRREAVVESCRYKARHHEDLARLAGPVLELLSMPDNHFKTAFDERMASGKGDLEAQIRWAESNPEFSAQATVAQAFDNLLVSRFFQATGTALLLRACEMELGRGGQRDFTPQQLHALETALAGCEAYLKGECDYLEEHMDYQVTPIWKLVTVQAECGLLTAQYVDQEKRKGKDDTL